MTTAPSDGPESEDNGLATPEATTLTRDELIADFRLVESYLPDGQTFEFIAVGGAPLVLLGLRGDNGSTADVDSITDLPPALADAAAHAAATSGLTTEWINTRAKAFTVNDPRPTTIVYDSRKLIVRAAAADDIFIMKVASAGTGGRLERDRSDLVALWRVCSYESPEEAVADYLDRVPMAVDDDPFLVDWIAAIAAEAQPDRPH